jgi:hypothetical protein
VNLRLCFISLPIILLNFPQSRNEVARMEEELKVHMEPICVRFSGPTQLQLALNNLTDMGGDIVIFQVDSETVIDKFNIKAKLCKRDYGDREPIAQLPPMFIDVSSNQVCTLECCVEIYSKSFVGENCEC